MEAYDIFQLYLQDRQKAIEEAWYNDTTIVEVTSKSVNFSGLANAIFQRGKKSLSFKLVYDMFTLEYNIIPCEPCNAENYINICEIDKCIVMSKFKDTHFKQLADKTVYVFGINHYESKDNRQKAVRRSDTMQMPKKT